MNDRRKDARAVKNSIGRAFFAALALCLQIGWIVSMIGRAGGLFPSVQLVTEILALVVAVLIVNQHRSAASKNLWILLILVFPVLGLLLYVLVGQPWATHTMRKRYESIDRSVFLNLQQDPDVLQALEVEDAGAASQMRYLQSWCKFPAYRNTQVEFHADTDLAFGALKAELKRAKKFIFMEYHAIECSSSFFEIEEILAERARAGVEVRLFYDDVGSVAFIDRGFVRRMEAQGIQCRVFNPILPIASAFMNNRDHRKITVIDGRVGFTGGYNLADEYFNRGVAPKSSIWSSTFGHKAESETQRVSALTHPYGHWKDTGVLLRGDAVRSLTLIFLEMWNAEKRMDDSFQRYICKVQDSNLSDGYVQPYADSPLDEERVGENVYMNVLKNARRYCWITTPYLILDDEMTEELTLAAKRGVDVRIITPGIPDKKLVFQLTRSYYAQLARCGVRIFEYAPGFMHAKQMLCDDSTAVVGTINLDYRSLYLHFEDAVLMYRCSAVRDVRSDFEATFPKCREMTDRYGRGRRMHTRIVQSLLRLLAPLL